MIAFKSLNIDGETREWEFESAEALEQEWYSEECDVPANDDSIWDVMIDGKPDLSEATYEKVVADDPVWFEDLLTYVGIEIWG